METEFYSKCKPFLIVLLFLIVIAAIILGSKAICTYCIANDSIGLFIVFSIILLLILFVIIGIYDWGCLPLIISCTIMGYSLFLIFSESNYKIVEKPEGCRYVFQTKPFDEVILFSGSKMEVIRVNGWIYYYASGRNKEVMEKTVLKTTDKDGSITLSSLVHNSLGREIYVNRADSLQIERRHYADSSFHGDYDVFRVWKGDSTFRIDMLGRNPDASDYSPLKYWDDSLVHWAD